MKPFKHLLATAALCVLSMTVVTAQTLVSEKPQNRTVVLEEFTGIHCGYCPDGHAIAKDIQESYPGDVVLINVHAGFYANPNAGEPDFRTQWGDALANWSELSGYPAGMVNRHLFGGQTVRGMGRAAWPAAAEEIIAMESPCNVGMKSEFDPESREVTITVEVYYTDNTFPMENTLNVVITESGVIGYQSGDAQGQQGNYTHNHIMRAMVTGQWGESFSHEGAGTKVVKEYVYTLPEAWDAENCNVAAYVSQGQAEVYSGAEVELVGGATTIIADATVQGEKDVVIEDAHVTSVSVTGLVPGTSQYKLELLGTVPADWSTEMSVNGESSTQDLIVEMAEGESMDVSITMVPASPGVAEVIVKCTSIDMPEAESQYVLLSAFRPSSEILINHVDAGNWGDMYMQALENAGATSVVSLTNEQMNKFVDASTILSSVDNIYYNVSWSFPAFTDPLTSWLMNQMDAGSNLFIAGQDIGWDVKSGHEAAHGTQLQSDFYSNYLHAEYLGDGDNTTMTATFTDPVLKYNEVGMAFLKDAHNGNMYPEQLATTAMSHEVFKYDANNVTGGVYAQVGDYKVVYLGVGLEQFTNVEQANTVMNITRDWFTGVISSVELDNAFDALFSSTTYPNPVVETLNIDIAGNVSSQAQIQISDVRGSLVSELSVDVSSSEIHVPVAHLQAGAYSWTVVANGTVIAGGRFVKK